MNELPQDLVSHLRHLYPRDELLSKYEGFDFFMNYMSALYPQIVKRYGEEKAKEMVMGFFEQLGAFLKAPEELDAYFLGRPYQRAGGQAVMRDRRGLGIPISGAFARGMGLPRSKSGGGEENMTKGEIQALSYYYAVTATKNGETSYFSAKTYREAMDLAAELRGLGATDVSVERVSKELKR